MKNITIKCDIDFIAFIAVCGAIVWKIVDCNDTLRYYLYDKKCDSGEEDAKSEE